MSLTLLLLFLQFYTSHGALPGYTVEFDASLPWIKPISSFNISNESDLVALSVRCSTLPSCSAFTSTGSLYSCPEGICGCDQSQSACIQHGVPGVDLYIKASVAPPPEWEQWIAQGRLLYAASPWPVCYSPAIGNGYIGGVQGWGAMYSAGLYNGKCGSVRKALLPSVFSVFVATAPHNTVQEQGSASPSALLPASTPRVPAEAPFRGAALDTRAGVVYRRWQVGCPAAFSAAARAEKSEESADATAPPPPPTGSLNCTIEGAFYAHRTRKHIGVVEFRWVSAPARFRRGGGGGSIRVPLATLFDPAVPLLSSLPGSGCAGPFSNDIAFRRVATSPNASAWVGRTLLPNDHGATESVAMVVDNIPPVVSLCFQCSVRFLSAVATSVFGKNASDSAVLAAAQDAHTEASAVSAPALFAEHVDGWQRLWESRIEVAPRNRSDEKDVYQTQSIATRASSSFYYIHSSVRDGWAAGVSPGGLATANYNGAVFMDMDMWIAPSFLLLRSPPSPYVDAVDVAATLVGYRFLSLPAAKANAARFGYRGSQFPWTAAALGEPFGCCDGNVSAGYENCLEQHVVGAVGVATWQYYLATRNMTWLRDVGWPILAGAADWHASRVTPVYAGNSTTSPTSFNITGVLPIDEWCVGSGCGCEKPGIDNDAQMNAVSLLTLRFAAEAAALLRVSSPVSEQWADVSSKIPILHDEVSHEIFQFTSESCPYAVGGSHYKAHHTVCPVDVNFLTFPLGEFLNLSEDTILANLKRYESITCEENPGMTAPIYTIAWLRLGPAYAAKAEHHLYRSMYAALYGPFHIRNEVDKHPGIIGAHYDNTNFVTGDGGYLQALLYGYGSIRHTSVGLKFLSPAVLPTGVGELTFRRLCWGSSFIFDYFLRSTGDSLEAILSVDSNVSPNTYILMTQNTTISLAGGARIALSTFPAILLQR